MRNRKLYICIENIYFYILTYWIELNWNLNKILYVDRYIRATIHTWKWRREVTILAAPETPAALAAREEAELPSSSTFLNSNLLVIRWCLGCFMTGLGSHWPVLKGRYGSSQGSIRRNVVHFLLQQERRVHFLLQILQRKTRQSHFSLWSSENWLIMMNRWHVCEDLSRRWGWFVKKRKVERNHSRIYEIIPCRFC